MSLSKLEMTYTVNLGEMLLTAELSWHDLFWDQVRKYKLILSDHRDRQIFGAESPKDLHYGIPAELRRWWGDRLSGSRWLATCSGAKRFT